MSDLKDFVIENGVLKNYEGTDENVVIPASVISIGNGAFSWCENLTSITIPDGVISIGNEAFSWCENLTSITIPNSVTSIGNEAFSWCENLTSITIPDGVTSIGDLAFCGCKNLTSITIPESVTCVGNEAFDGCKALANITIPKNVVSIGAGAFSNCNKLLKFNIASENTAFVSQDGVLFSKNFSKLMAYSCGKKSKEYTIPDSVTVIEDGAFSCCKNLTSIIIPDTVTSIGYRAFAGCENLKELKIPDSVTKIGNYAFDECNSLQSVKLPAKILVNGICFSAGKKLSNINYFGTKWPFNLPIRDFFGYNHSTEKEWANFTSNLSFFAPNLQFDIIKSNKLTIAAAKAFIMHFLEYHDANIVNDYLKYIATQKLKLLPLVLNNDNVEIIQKLTEIKKITEKNAMEDYYLPAKNCNAEKCCRFLEETFCLFSDDAKQETNSLWNDVYFSLNGQKMLKCPCEKGEKEYYVPEGTKEICAGAFDKTSLHTIYVPSTVINIRAGAFSLGKKDILNVYLSNSPIKIALKIVERENWWDESYVNLFTYDADVATTFAKKSGVIPVYLGDIEVIAAHAKKRLIENFVAAVLNGQINSSHAGYTSYMGYIKRNNKTFVERAIKNELLLQFLVLNEVITASSCKKLLSELKRADQKALILEYQNRMFGNKTRKDDFSLNSVENAVKKQNEADERRIKVKDKKDIIGVVFVVSGALENFGEYTEIIDRSDLKKFIEDRGGFLRSSVSTKTDYLICNDARSNSTKVKKAKELNVPIITEAEFLALADAKRT